VSAVVFMARIYERAVTKVSRIGAGRITPERSWPRA
jgi:hypothetical protein